MSGAQVDEATPLNEKRYYGQNDWKPMSGGKLMSPHQLAGLKIFKILDPWYKAPGQRLATKTNDENSTDILIPASMVDETGCLRSCGGLGISLRKSLEHTVDSDIREGPYSKQVTADIDVNGPRYLLNGSLYNYDPKYDELWASPGRMCQWPSVYCWSGHLPGGGSMFTEVYCCSDKISTDSLPDVLGYIYLLEVSNPKYYEADRVQKVGFTPNCPEITPENEGKVFARYGYMDAYNFGNVKTDGSEPDAYIFKGKALTEANMKLLHTYRIIKPSNMS